MLLISELNAKNEISILLRYTSVIINWISDEIKKSQEN